MREGYNQHMANQLIQQAMELPPRERIELIQALWDSLPQESTDVRLSDAQMEELKRRERLIEENGPTGDTRDVVEKRLRARLR